MPPIFEAPDIVTDDDELTQQVLDNLADRMPGWEPVEGSVETALAEEFATETGVVAQVAVDSILTAVAGIGETLHGLPVEPGTLASLTAELSVSDIGAVIPAGLLLIGTNPAGVEVAFVLPGAVTATSETQTVALVANDVGAASNGVTGPLVVATATATVVSAEAAAESSGGVDPEAIEAYLQRLVVHLSALRLGGVRAQDLAAIALTVPGVDRATGIDLRDPSQPGVQVERAATVVPVDALNRPVSAEIKAAVMAQLQAVREVNFLVFVADPTYTPVHVTYTAVAEAGYVLAQVRANVDAALTAYLTDWGATPGDPRSWTNQTVVRFLDVARVAGGADGVAYLSAITVNGGTADVTLGGVAPLPAPFTGADPSTIVGTVQ